MSELRLVHLGVVAAIAAATATAGGLIRTASAASADASAFVPIVPCRLADTRPGTDNVGTRATPIPADTAVTFQVEGSVGNCTIPADATGIAANVTAVNPTASSYFTIYPADAPTRPLSANLNWTATSPPTPNQVPVKLSATGAINVYNFAGTVDIVIDVVGFYEPSLAGPAGPPGAPGAPGAPGTARAFALVASNGTFSRAKNVTGVTRLSPGRYCVTLDPSVSAATTVAVVAPNFANNGTSIPNTGGNHSIVEWDATNDPTCPPNSMKVVTAVHFNNDAFGNVAADQGFSIIVP